MFFCSDYLNAMYKEKRNILLSIFLFLQIGIVTGLSYQSTLIDRYYVNGLYPVIAKALRIVFGWIPFSIGDLLYAVLIILIVRFLIKFFHPRTKNRKGIFFSFLAGLSIFYFCFYLFWGLNYSRSPLSKTLSLHKEPFDIVKLEEMTTKVLNKTNSLQKELSAHDTLAVVVPYSKKKILDLTIEGYDQISIQFPFLAYERPSLKKSIFSLPLTYMGFAGYLNPLTGEAQVDYLIPKVNLPFTCSHEVAHQIGYAFESEANFVGFLAAVHHTDPYFQYAAYLLVLRYALIDIKRYDPELFKTYLERIPKGVLKNIRETDDFWRRYQNPLEPFFKMFYDYYLKYNQQEDGLESYNQIIDLLISYDKSYPLDFN